MSVVKARTPKRTRVGGRSDASTCSSVLPTVLPLGPARDFDCGRTAATKGDDPPWQTLAARCAYEVRRRGQVRKLVLLGTTGATGVRLDQKTELRGGRIKPGAANGPGEVKLR